MRTGDLRLRILALGCRFQSSELMVKGSGCRDYICFDFGVEVLEFKGGGFKV